jgi:hypothetical protein
MRMVEFELADNNGKMLVNPAQVARVHIESSAHGAKTIMHFADGNARAIKGSLEEVKEKLDNGMRSVELVAS